MGQYKYVKNYRKRLKTEIISALGNKCQCCGYDRCMEALEFHHLDPTQKDVSISGKSWSIVKLGSEIQKCIMVCACCHREIHYNGLPIPENFYIITDDDIKRISELFIERGNSTKWQQGHKHSAETLNKFRNRMWITNGTETKSVSKDYVLEDGWFKGRKI